MNVDKALELIGSPQPHERLRGARNLARLARLSDIPRMQQALAEETVPWVRNAIETALAATNQESPSIAAQDTEVDTVSEAVRRDIYLRMGDEVVSTVLHEIQPKVGFIRNAAAREVPNFDASDTRKRIEYLEDMLSLLAEFRKVSKPPKLIEFDFWEVIDQATAEIGPERVQLAGARPFLVFGEPKRIRLAIINGLRNAVEATDILSPDKREPVTINWGATDTEFWASVVDQGVGIQGGLDAMFQVGKTTKAGHYGMGLPLARQAMASLGGQVTVGPGAVGGTRFEIKWERVLPFQPVAT